MLIRDAEGLQLLDVQVDDSSFRYRELMGDDYLSLSFRLEEYVRVDVGAWCEHDGAVYTAMKPADVTIKSRRWYEYTVRLDSVRALLKRKVVLDNIDARSRFPLTAKPHEHLQMVVDNLNRTDPGWSVGNCIAGDEKCITYDMLDCWKALEQIADTFETEFDIVGKAISLRKAEYNKLFPLQLSYGKGNGLRTGVKISADSQDGYPIDMLYVQGGDQNINKSSYGSKTLLLPPPDITYIPPAIRLQSIRYDGTKFEDEPGFDLVKATEYMCLGRLIIRSLDVDRKNEASLDCTDIYPKRVGTVSSVQVTPSVDPEVSDLYDITDDSIPQNLDYSECQIPGEKMVVVFQSGMLAGKEFEVDTYIHEADANHPARTFLLVSAEIDGETMPNETFAPAVGDKYAVFGCALPAAYISDNATKSGASWEMFRAGVRHMHSSMAWTYDLRCDVDEIWVREHWLTDGHKFRAGGCVLVYDTDVIGGGEGLLTRITSVKDYINDRYKMELELSNTNRVRPKGKRLADYVGISSPVVSAVDAASAVQQNAVDYQANDINMILHI